jgi:hypothetical protein
VVRTLPTPTTTDQQLSRSPGVDEYPKAYEAQQVWAFSNSFAICAVNAFCNSMLMSARCDESAVSRASRRVSARQATVGDATPSGGLLRQKPVTETVLKNARADTDPSAADSLFADHWVPVIHEPSCLPIRRAASEKNAPSVALCVADVAASIHRS